MRMRRMTNRLLVKSLRLALRLSRRSSDIANGGATSSFTLRTHTCGELGRDHVGQEVTLYGWLGRARLQPAHGVAFLPLHDASGVTQFVCDLTRWHAELETCTTAREKVARVGGVVRLRPPEAVNANQGTGEIEVEVTSLEVINESSHQPFSTFVHSEPNVSTEQQLRERPHFLRLPHMHRNLRLRSEVGMSLREFLVRRHGFLEVETPTLFRRTPEGAQEFVVPTREQGKFFSLAQSPQQFKQLLMVAGVERYFQFARCYRDEGQRSDRQPEFTQLDLEMAFVDDDCVMRLTEELVSSTVSSLCPQFSIPDTPFPRMEYRQVMEQYGSDKPDTRFGLHLQNVGVVWSEILEEMGLGEREREVGLNTHVFGLKVPEWQLATEELEKQDRAKAKEVKKRARELSLAHSMATVTMDDGESLKSLERLLSRYVPRAHPSQESHLTPALARRVLERVRESVGCRQQGDLCVLATSEGPTRDRMLTGLGQWRTMAADVLNLTGRLELDSTQLNFLWVTDFPLFTVSEGEREGEFSVCSTHHPFTAPVEGDRERVWRGDFGPEELGQVCVCVNILLRANHRFAVCT